MKRSEIQVGKRYSAKVHFTENVIVDVLEVGVERAHGYRNDKRMDGVRVRIVFSFSKYGREEPAGSEKVITTRDVAFEWTAEHQQRHDAREAEAKRNRQRADAIEDALVAHGTFAKVDAKSGSVRLTLDQAEKLLGLDRVAPRKERKDG